MTAPLRIMQVISGGAFGGAEMAFVDICRGLQEAGVEQHIVVRQDRAWAELLQQTGLPVTEVPFRGRLDFRTHLRWRRAIEQFQPQFVQTWMNRASRRCPRAGRDGFWQVGRLGGYYNIKNYRHCRHLIANTPDIARHVIEQGWPSERVTVLWNYAEAEAAAPLARAEFGTPEGVPLLVALGRLHTVKAFDTMIEAMIDVPQAHLWIAGEGPERVPLQTLIDQYNLADRVQLIGWRNRAAVFAAADVCVFPSRSEPFGNVAIQAWAQGVPLVTTASEGPGSYVRHGEDGLVVPVDDAVALATAIQQVLADQTLQQKLVKNGKARHKVEFSKAAVIKAYVEFYQRLLAEKTKGQAHVAQ